MRTDSFNLSNDAFAGIAAHVQAQYGDNYYHHANSIQEQRCTEAQGIRPTNFSKNIAGADDRQKNYTTSSTSALLLPKWPKHSLKTRLLNYQTQTHPMRKLTARGQVITFDGFIRVYQEGTDDENAEQLDGQLPAVTVGDLLRSDEITATERFTKHVPCYTEVG